MRGERSNYIRLWDWTPASLTASPWRPLSALLVAGFMIAVLLVLNVTLFVAILAYRHPGVVGSLVAFSNLSELERAVPAIQAGLIAQALLIGALLVIVRRGGANARDALPLAPPRSGLKRSARTTTAFIAATYTLFGVVYLLFPYDAAKVAPVIAALARSDLWWLLLLMLIVGAPAFEELLFRGFLFPALAKSWLGVTGAAVASSALWTTMHVGYPPQLLATIFVVGLMLAAVLVASRSLWVPLACHATYNAISFAYFRWLADLT